VNTDEYEISIGREVTHCRMMIERLKKGLHERESRYGMSTEDFLKTRRQGGVSGQNRDHEAWHEESLELEFWRTKLREYEEALQLLKGI
jgi:hypothetical protein